MARDARRRSLTSELTHKQHTELVGAGKKMFPVPCECGGRYVLVGGVMIANDRLHWPFAVRCDKCGLTLPIATC